MKGSHGYHSLWESCHIGIMEKRWKTISFHIGNSCSDKNSIMGIQLLISGNMKSRLLISFPVSSHNNLCLIANWPPIQWASLKLVAHQISTQRSSYEDAQQIRDNVIGWVHSQNAPWTPHSLPGGQGLDWVWISSKFRIFCNHWYHDLDNVMFYNRAKMYQIIWL